MKKTHVAALVAALVVMPAAAGAQQPGEARQFGVSPRALAAAQAELGLSAQQVQQLEAIAERLQAQNLPLLEQLRAHGFGPGTAAAQRRRQLTPEQREQMRQRVEQRHERMTPEQREQMRQRMEQRHEQMTPEQREQMRQRMEQRGTPGRAVGERRIPEEARPILEQIQANTRAAQQEAQAVLTPEQQAKARELAGQRMREMRERRGEPRLQRSERRDGAGWQRFRGGARS